MSGANELMLSRRFRALQPISSAGTLKSFNPKSWIQAAAREGGMTLLEMLFAMVMITTFTGVVVVVMEFANRFFVDSEGNGNGVLVEHAELQIDMDRLVEVLSQSAIPLSDIKNFSSVYIPSLPLPPTCVRPGQNFAVRWNLPIPKMVLTTDGYSLCLWSTSPAETPSSPGVYVLQAVPDKISASKLPTRRIFCRPRHLC